MNRFCALLVTLGFVIASVGFSCGQNGPTKPSVVLNWTQSTTTGVTANCVYRGTAANSYALPAIFCSTTPITSFTDTSIVPGNTYHYAVTAQVSGTEGNFSNDALAVVPQLPSPPTNLAPGTITGKVVKPKKDGQLTARVVWTK